MDDDKFSEKDWITHDQLDTPISELTEETSNKDTPRQFIYHSESEMGLPHRTPEDMTRNDLNKYIEFLDDLWLK